MAKTPNIDPEQIRNDAIQIGNAVAEQAKNAAQKAANAAGQGIEWAAPRAQQAVDSVKEHAAPIISDASEKVRSDYIPRINQAFNDAISSGKTDVDLPEHMRLSRDASIDALQTPMTAHKPRHFRKLLGFTALGVSAAGIGYLLWRRSQPIEDPWAEEYWADIDDIDADLLPDFDAEDVGDAVDEVEDKIDSTIDKTKDVVEELNDEADSLTD